MIMGESVFHLGWTLAFQNSQELDCTKKHVRDLFNVQNGEILLMVQKSGSPVEVGSLSHYLQGFFYIPGG